MMRLVALALFVALLGSMTMGCSPEAAPSKEYTDEKQPIEAAAGQQFIIALKSNPTTGYKWEATFDPNALKLVSDEYKQDASQPGMVGVGGVQRFTFQGLKAGKADVALTYRQPWPGGNTGEKKVFTVTVK